MPKRENATAKPGRFAGLGDEMIIGRVIWQPGRKKVAALPKTSCAAEGECTRRTRQGGSSALQRNGSRDHG